ncbi:MAG: ThiF family adenylyltransferase [Acidimicrobiales bacterium]|nr:ThiF family adenylyltransferase [Acidimicrobiales bacterium]
MPATDLTVDLVESRFDRQERITWWDQNRLSAGRVLVVGAGALGNEIVKNLVLVGIGSVVVVDFDVVESSNLSRCVFFRPEDEGLYKAEVLARRANELSPATTVHALTCDIRALGSGIAYRADVMVGGLDSRESRLHLNRMAWRSGRPWVDGAIEGLYGVARVFSPSDSCYECTLTDADYALLSHRQSCRLLSHDELAHGKVPTTATTSSVVAGVQVQEVIKLLHRPRDGVTLLRDALVFDGANNDAYPLRYPRRADCLAHETFADPIVVGADRGTTFRSLVESSGIGDSSRVELSADHLTAWRCTACQRSWAASGVVAMATFDDSRCPDCDGARQPVTTTAVEVPGVHADRSLADLGVARDEVFAIRLGPESRYVWATESSHLPEGWR